MPARRVIVVAETRSLGAAVSELLVSDGLDAPLVRDLAEAEHQAAMIRAKHRLVLVAAASGRECETVERWPHSSLREAPLVVVGARDLDPTSRARLHVVPLPLDPVQFLDLVRSLLGIPVRGRTGDTGAVRVGPDVTPPHREEATSPHLRPVSPPGRDLELDTILEPRASPPRA
ncbi:MAG: hypothetical protein L3K00_05615 [Thermoplasmata archaeon]|nr:hypothetical protein [Thermoplasmata archaeon]